MEREARLKGSWYEIKGLLKQKYAQLTDDDLLFAEGKEDELLGRLEKKLGKSKEEVSATLAKLQSELHSVKNESE